MQKNKVLKINILPVYLLDLRGNNFIGDDMTYKIKIFGNVQGVGFRYFVKNSADTLGLKGWIKNNDDGSVELSVQTESETMDQFATMIEKGNGFCRVECIDIIELAETSHYKRFEILNE